MKPRLSFLLLLTLCLPFGGAYLFLQLRQELARGEAGRRIEAGIDREGLTLFRFSQQDVSRLDWQEAGREFRYQGYFYDIVDKEVVGDSIYYRCYRDEAETEIADKLNELIGGLSPSPTSERDVLRQLFHFLSALFYSPIGTLDHSIDTFAGRAYSRSSACISYLSAPPVPPPENAFV